MPQKFDKISVVVLTLISNVKTKMEAFSENLNFMFLVCIINLWKYFDILSLDFGISFEITILVNFLLCQNNLHLVKSGKISNTYQCQFPKESNCMDLAHTAFISI